MFRLKIITIEKVVVDQEVKKLSVPTKQGEIGILSGHVPLLTAIRPGEVRLSDDKKELRLVVTQGSLEVKDNLAKLLVDEAVPVEQIDVAKAEAERDRLLNVMKSKKVPLMELNQAKKDLANVLAQIKIKR